MRDNLPRDVLIDLLSRLPIKNILQCRRVCKSWCSLISSSDFVSAHIKNSTTGGTHLLLVRYCPTIGTDVSDRFVLLQDENFCDYNVDRVDCPFSIAGSGSGSCSVEIVGNCNGVLCLSDPGVNGSRFALWNPSIRALVDVPSPIVPFSQGLHFRLVGFGFDSAADDYKLVRLIYDEVFDCTTAAEVYSFRSNSWRLVVDAPRYVILAGSLSGFVNGACHWLAHTPDRSRFVILLFDLRNGVFKEMPVPDELPFGDYRNATVAVSDGSLMLVLSKREGHNQWYSVWVMRVYGDVGSWMRAFSIKCHDKMGRMVAFRKNAKVVVAQSVNHSFLPWRNGAELVSLDLNTREEKVCNIWGKADSFYVDTFVQSLALLNHTNRIPN